MWEYPNILIFEDAISDQKKINMALVISFDKIDTAINFITSRPNSIQIMFKNKKECEDNYKYLRARFCREVNLSKEDDLPF